MPSDAGAGDERRDADAELGQGHEDGDRVDRDGGDVAQQRAEGARALLGALALHGERAQTLGGLARQSCRAGRLVLALGTLAPRRVGLDEPLDREADRAAHDEVQHHGGDQDERRRDQRVAVLLEPVGDCAADGGEGRDGVRDGGKRRCCGVRDDGGERSAEGGEGGHAGSLPKAGRRPSLARSVRSDGPVLREARHRGSRTARFQRLRFTHVDEGDDAIS